MPVVPFGEYRPDLSDYEGASERDALNVVPRGDGYGPFPSLAALSLSLGAPCRGAITASKTDGSVVIFAATSTDIYQLNNTTFAWAKVSLAGGPYSALSAGDMWVFRQFNNLVFATQANVVLQVFNIATDTLFSNALGNPPQARYMDIIGKFLVLGGLLSNPNRVQWSGLNDVNSANSWTAGLNSSDFQDLMDGGFCRGIAGGETGVILQDTIIRRMIYLPGSPLIFQIEKIAEGLGIYAPYSLVRSGSTIYFYSLKGFHRIDPGGLPTPIGRERIDRTFFTDLDAANLQLFQGIADPRSSRILWAYKSVNGVIGQFDKILCYDAVLDKFTSIRLAGECMMPMAPPGVTLEGLDALVGTNIDLVTQSLDNFQSAVILEMAAFDTGHLLNFFRGPALEAVLETSEQGTDGRRIKIRNGFRPITDAPVVYGSCSSRENLQAATVAGAESQINPVTGVCNLLVDTRYSRFKVRIPAGTAWSFVNGVEPDMIAVGKR